MDYQNDPTAQKLYAFLERWIRKHPNWAYESSGWRMNFRDVDSIAASLLEDTEFGEVNLAGWLKSPDGQLIQTVVSLFLPWPEGTEFKLLVDAIALAAQARQKKQQGVAAGLTLVAAVALLFIALSESGRGPHSLSSGQRLL